MHTTSSRRNSRARRQAFVMENCGIFLNLRKRRRDRQFLLKFSPGRRKGFNGRMLSRGDRSSGAHCSCGELVNVDHTATFTLGSSSGGLESAAVGGVNSVVEWDGGGVAIVKYAQ